MSRLLALYTIYLFFCLEQYLIKIAYDFVAYICKQTLLYMKII